MVIKIEKTKSLDKTEYQLECAYPTPGDPNKKHDPEIIIIPFKTFGLGSMLFFEKSKNDLMTEIDWETSFEQGAQVTSLYSKGNKIIIEAERKIDKSKKIKVVNSIVDKIDFKAGLGNEIFIKMLSNVFTDKQLNHFLEQKDIEILMFKGLMYLKSGKKAYRL